MSDSWIKLRADLDTDPRVFTMADLLRQTAQSYVLTNPPKDLLGDVTATVTRNVMRDVTIAGLSRVWFAANRHTTDGIFKKADLHYLDTLAQVPGFGLAMQSVGYAIHDPEAHTVTLPRFEEYNAPDKNGQRKKTANALRQQRLRDRRKEEHITQQEALRNAQNNVTPSYSPSPSISEGTEGTQEPGARHSDAALGSPATPPPPSGQSPVTDTPNPLPVFSLESIKPRISAMRPAWSKMHAWTYEEEAALLNALPNLQALDDRDWARLEDYMKWANSTANQGRDAHRVTSRRHLFLAELPAYLDRANTHAKHHGTPKRTTSGSGQLQTSNLKPETPAPAPPAGPTVWEHMVAEYGLETRKPNTGTTKPAAA